MKNTSLKKNKILHWKCSNQLSNFLSNDLSCVEIIEWETVPLRKPPFLRGLAHDNRQLICDRYEEIFKV